jgi:hypothetical protein
LDEPKGMVRRPGMPAVVDNENVATWLHDARDFSDGVRSEALRQMADVVAGEGSVELLYRGRNGQTITVDEPCNVVLEASPCAFKQIGTEVESDAVIADAGMRCGSQHSTRATPNFQ